MSIYGNDNSLILDTLEQSGGTARAVVSIDPVTISDRELYEMHRIGVRGVRLNLKTWAKTCTRSELEAQLFLYADRIRHLDWVLQIYLGLDQVALISRCVPNLGVGVVIDHMASPDPCSMAEKQVGYQELFDLHRRGLIWIKLSGVYRFERLPDLDEFARSLIRTNPSKVVWASDWPHTGGTAYNKDGDRFATQDYREVNDLAFVERCYAWCQHQDDLIEKVFVHNPRELWTSADRGLEQIRSNI